MDNPSLGVHFVGVRLVLNSVQVQASNQQRLRLGIEMLVKTTILEVRILVYYIKKILSLNIRTKRFIVNWVTCCELLCLVCLSNL